MSPSLQREYHAKRKRSGVLAQTHLEIMPAKRKQCAEQCAEQAPSMSAGTSRGMSRGYLSSYESTRDLCVKNFHMTNVVNLFVS